MFVLPLLSLVTWCSLPAFAWFWTNITIDDTKGDYATSAGVDYGVGNFWSDVQNCTENDNGLVCPNPKAAFEQTYHVTAAGGASASVTFTGTSLTVYGILVWNASTELTFMLDGEFINEGFTHTANGSSTISYDVQMFTTGSLSFDTHTFTMTNGYNSLAIFDYMSYSTQASIDAVTRKSNTGKVVAVVVVIIVVIFALGGALYYCRRRRYKGYGPPMDRIFCRRPAGRGTSAHRSVDLVQDGWGEKGLRPQQSNPSIRAGLLKPEGVPRTQGSSTIVGTSSTGDKLTSAELKTEAQSTVVGESPPVSEVEPPVQLGLQFGGTNASSPPQVRHGHPPTFQLAPLKIPERHTQTVVVAPGSNTSSSKTPPPLPPRALLSNRLEEDPPANSQLTPQNMPHSSPPTSFPSPPSSQGSKKNKRPRPKSDPRSGFAGRSDHMRTLSKRRSAVNGAATPSTGSRTSGMIASDRTTASTPTSMLAPDFCWDNTSMPDLPARADSVKTVSTMPLNGRHCDRLTGNVYVDTTPLPDNASFPLRSNTDKSSGSASPGTAWTTNGSSTSHTRSFSPPATLAELEPVPVVDRRPVVESPVSLPNSPNAPLIATALQVVASAQIARMSAYSDSAVPIGPRLPIRDEVLRPPALPDQPVEKADAPADEGLVIVSPPLEAEAHAAPSNPAVRPSSVRSVSDAGSTKAKPPSLPPDSPKELPSELPVVGSPTAQPSQLGASPPEGAPSPTVIDSPIPGLPALAQDYVDTARRSLTPSEAPLAPPGIEIMHEGHGSAPPQQNGHPALSIVVQSNTPEPPSRIARMEGDRPRKLPPVPLSLSSRLDTVVEDVVSPRFRRPLPRPQPQQQEVNRSLSMTSTTTSRDSLDTAEVTVGERFNISSAVGHSLQVHSPQPSAPVLLTPGHDLFAQWHLHSDSSDTSSVSSRPVALTRENSMSSAGACVVADRAPAPDTSIPRLWSRPSLDKVNSSPSSTPAEGTPSSRALPLVPNRAPDVVLGTMLQVDRGGSEASSLSSPSASNVLLPNRHPAMPLIGPRALPAVNPSDGGSKPSLGRGKSTRRFGL